MTTADRRVDLHWTAADDAAVDRWWAECGLGGGHPVVQVHPTSRWFFKCWDEEKNARVIDVLQERGLRVVVTDALRAINGHLMSRRSSPVAAGLSRGS